MTRCGTGVRTASASISPVGLVQARGRRGRGGVPGQCAASCAGRVSRAVRAACSVGPASVAMGPDDPVCLSEYEDRVLDELVALWRASFEAGVGITDPHPLADQRRHFLERVLPANTVRIATHGGQLVGFVAASSESISQLYVRVGFQRHGIGSLQCAVL